MAKVKQTADGAKPGQSTTDISGNNAQAAATTDAATSTTGDSTDSSNTQASEENILGADAPNEASQQLDGTGGADSLQEADPLPESERDGKPKSDGDALTDAGDNNQDGSDVDELGELNAAAPASTFNPSDDLDEHREDDEEGERLDEIVERNVPDMLAAIGRQQMEDYGIDEVYMTYDGTTFDSLTPAHSYAASLPDRKIYHITAATPANNE